MRKVIISGLLFFLIFIGTGVLAQDLRSEPIQVVSNLLKFFFPLIFIGLVIGLFFVFLIRGLRTIESSLKTLSWTLRLFGWLSIILGILFLIQFIFSDTTSLVLLLLTISWFLNGLVFLFLAAGLSKKEQWSWYATLIVFILGSLSLFAQGFLIEFSIEILLSLLIYIFLFALLVKTRQLFIEQPKEKVSQWFRKPYFVVVMVGILISSLISGGVLVYSISQNIIY